MHKFIIVNHEKAGGLKLNIDLLKIIIHYNTFPNWFNWVREKKEGGRVNESYIANETNL